MRRADRPLKDHVAKLIELSQQDPHSATRKAGLQELERLVLQMHNDPVPAYIPSLIVMLGAGSAVARRAAETLGALARRQPTADLAEALPALQQHFWRSGAPLEFLVARRAITRALRSDLPIPAAAPEMSVADLPIPVEPLDD